MAKNISPNRSTLDSRFSRAAQESSALSLSEQLKKIMRHPLVLLTFIVGGVLLGGVASALQSPSYTTTAKVVVYPLAVDPNAQATNQLTVQIDTESSVASSLEVAEKAANNIDPSNQGLPNKLNNSVKVTPHSGSDILEFIATSDSAEDAANYANHAAEAYLSVRQDSLKKQVETNAQNIRAALNELGDGDGTARTALQERLSQVEVTSTSPGRVITYAKAPSDSDNLALWKYVLVGLVAGAILGAVAAVIADNRKRTLGYEDRAQILVKQNVFPIRAAHQAEDARRMLLSVGLTQRELDEHRQRGAVLYSPTEGASVEFAQVLAESTNPQKYEFIQNRWDIPQGVETSENAQKTVIVTPEYSEISEVLEISETLGTCIVVLKPETSTADIKEFVSVAENTEADIEYAYLHTK